MGIVSTVLGEWLGEAASEYTDHKIVQNYKLGITQVDEAEAKALGEMKAMSDQAVEQYRNDLSNMHDQLKDYRDPVIKDMITTEFRKQQAIMQTELQKYQFEIAKTTAINLLNLEQLKGQLVNEMFDIMIDAQEHDNPLATFFARAVGILGLTTSRTPSVEATINRVAENWTNDPWETALDMLQLSDYMLDQVLASRYQGATERMYHELRDGYDRNAYVTELYDKYRSPEKKQQDKASLRDVSIKEVAGLISDIAI